MHITYDLPVAIDDIIEAKQRLAGRIYKTGMPRVHLKFVAHLIN